MFSDCLTKKNSLPLVQITNFCYFRIVKYLVSILVLCFAMQAVKGQPLKPLVFKTPGLTKTLSFNKDSAAVMQSLQDYLAFKKGQNKQQDTDSVFNVFREKLPMPRYKGNNGNGFDIYESTVDNMPLLVPDKNNDAVPSTVPGEKTPKLENWFKGPEQLPNYQYYRKPLPVRPYR